MNSLAKKTIAALLGLALILPVAASSAETPPPEGYYTQPWTYYRQVCVEENERSWRCDFWRDILSPSNKEDPKS